MPTNKPTTRCTARNFLHLLASGVANKNHKKYFLYFLFVFLLLLIDFLSSTGLRLKKKKNDYAPVGWAMVSLEIGVLELAFSPFFSIPDCIGAPSASDPFTFNSKLSPIR
jgi:hypothetical protein